MHRAKQEAHMIQAPRQSSLNLTGKRRLNPKRIIVIMSKPSRSTPRGCSLPRDSLPHPGSRMSLQSQCLKRITLFSYRVGRGNSRRLSPPRLAPTLQSSCFPVCFPYKSESSRGVGEERDGILFIFISSVSCVAPRSKRMVE